VKRYDLEEKSNGIYAHRAEMVECEDGEFVRYSEVMNNFGYLYDKCRYDEEDLRCLEADLLRALESLNARRRIRENELE
jgi:hypothetical protein